MEECMKKFLLGILGATLVFGLILTGCESGTVARSSDATLKSVTVNGVEAMLGTPSSNWMSVTSGFVGLSADKLEGALVKTTSSADGAIVYYYKGAFDDTPNFSAAATFTFDYEDCLFIRVFSANHDAEQFYQIAIIPDTAVLTKITVAEADVKIAKPSKSWIDTGAGSVSLPVSRLANAAIVVEGGVGIQYAKTKSAVEPSDFSNTATISFAPDDVLAIRVGTAEPYYYYQIAIVNTTPAITDITLGGRSATGGSQLSGVPIPRFGDGVGVPGASWNDENIVEGEVWYGTSQEGTQLPLTVIKELSTTTWKAAVAPDGTAPTFDTVTTITPINGQYLYLETASPDGGLSYYKIKLTAKNDDRSLTSVTIGGRTMGIGALGTHSFPGAEAYGNYSNGAELAQNGTGIFDWTNLADLNSVAIVVEATNSLDIKYGHTETERDYLIDFTADANLSLKIGEWIALEVTSELGEKGWYKFRAKDADIVNGGTLGGNAVTPGKMTVTPGTFGTTITGTAYQLLLEEALTGSVTLNVTSIDGITGLTVEAGIMTADWGGPGLPSSWNNGTFSNGIAFDSTVMLRVTANQLAGTQYYAVSVLKDGPPEINSLQVGAVFNFNTFGYDPVVSITNIGTPSADKEAVVAGSVILTDSQAGAAMPILGTAGSGVSLTFAKTTGAAPDDAEFAETIAPNFTTTFVHEPSYNFADGDVIWVKAVRGSYTNYYKVAVSVVVLTSNDAQVTALQVGGYPGFGGGVEVENLGTPANAIGGEITEGAVTLTQAQATSETMAMDGSLGPNICVTVGQYAAFRVAKTAGDAPQESDWKTQTQSSFGPTNPQLIFENNDILWIEGSAGNFKQFYKIKVTVVE
jgi:hypothetical protein